MIDEMNDNVMMLSNYKFYLSTREQSHHRDVNYAKDLIVTYFSQLITTVNTDNDLVSAILHGLRYLRNICVDAPHNQEYLL